VRQQWPEEQHQVAAGQQDRGEVLDVEVAHQFGFVLDVDPGESQRDAGVRGLQRVAHVEEGVAVGVAGAAPLRAQAGHEQGL
jgi:hypothetical protein